MLLSIMNLSPGFFSNQLCILDQFDHKTCFTYPQNGASNYVYLFEFLWRVCRINAWNVFWKYLVEDKFIVFVDTVLNFQQNL